MQVQVKHCIALPEPEAWFASPVDIPIDPEGPEVLNEVTSGLSMTMSPDIEDELDPETKVTVPPLLSSPIESPAAMSTLPPCIVVAVPAMTLMSPDDSCASPVNRLIEPAAPALPVII